MSTLHEIEAAVGTLRREEQRALLEHLAATLDQPLAAPGEVSLYERTREFCGIVDSGVPDLATDKKYLEGLGSAKG